MVDERGQAMGDRKLRNILEGMPENGCQHRNVVPEADPNWGYCPECGEDSFPLTAEAAGMSDETIGCGTFGANQLPSSPVKPGLSAARVIVELDRKIASLETANNCLSYANKQLAEQHDKAVKAIKAIEPFFHPDINRGPAHDDWVAAAKVLLPYVDEDGREWLKGMIEVGEGE